MLRKVLIANRGEIACRIIRSCREMGLFTVAVFSDADRHALHVAMADEALHIGDSDPADSYLNIHKILDAAVRSGADAIHPGYGFLAENPMFAYVVVSSNLMWIGPPPEAIEVMGNKQIARLILQDVPLIPGIDGGDDTDFAGVADEIGYPVMIKAAAGGGGKGMRLVNNPDDLADALAAARREAQQAFGDASVYLEKALENPRHIEVQIFGDLYGNIVAIGERECSIQRRHQKIIEESPSKAVDADLRRRMCETAVSIGKQAGYYSAGTVEFLLDDDGNYYFMEMNTRLQVEHPVTELVYEIDLVRWQLEAARGMSLEQLLPGENIKDYHPKPQGHAIEARVYAEDPATGFLPMTGQITAWDAPDNVRVDAGIRSGDTITPYYDPMIAKIIAHGETRTDAIRKLDYALAKTVLAGLRNNIAFLRRVLMSDEHLAGIISTQFLEEFPELLEDDKEVSPQVLIAAALARQQHGGQWRNNPNRALTYRFQYGDDVHEVQLTPRRDGSFVANITGDMFKVWVHDVQDTHISVALDGYLYKIRVIPGVDNRVTVYSMDATFELTWISPLPLPGEREVSAGSLRAPMPGQVIQIAVSAGDTVAAGDLLLIVEAMKMEHRIEAPYAGTVETLFYTEGDSVQQDAILLELNADNPD